MPLYSCGMSAAPILPTYGPIETSQRQSDLTDADQRAIQLADQDEGVVNRCGAARGILVGIVVGSVAWAGIILASAALIK